MYIKYKDKYKNIKINTDTYIRIAFDIKGKSQQKSNQSNPEKSNPLLKSNFAFLLFSLVFSMVIAHPDHVQTVWNKSNLPFAFSALFHVVELFAFFSLVFRMVEAEEEYTEQLEILISCFLRPFKVRKISCCENLHQKPVGKCRWRRARRTHLAATRISTPSSSTQKPSSSSTRCSLPFQCLQTGSN